MEAVDPIDVTRIVTGYYTTLAEQDQVRYPTPVVLFSGGTADIDAKASREAYVAVLRERLQDEFPKAAAIEISCADGQAARSSLTEVSLTRANPPRLRLATEWVDAIAKLVWAQGRWIAPAGTE